MGLGFRIVLAHGTLVTPVPSACFRCCTRGLVAPYIRERRRWQSAASFSEVTFAAVIFGPNSGIERRIVYGPFVGNHYSTAGGSRSCRRQRLIL